MKIIPLNGKTYEIVKIKKDELNYFNGVIYLDGEVMNPIFIREIPQPQTPQIKPVNLDVVDSNNRVKPSSKDIQTFGMKNCSSVRDKTGENHIQPQPPKEEYPKVFPNKNEDTQFIVYEHGGMEIRQGWIYVDKKFHNLVVLENDDTFKALSQAVELAKKLRGEE